MEPVDSRQQMEMQLIFFQQLLWWRPIPVSLYFFYVKNWLLTKNSFVMKSCKLFVCCFVRLVFRRTFNTFRLSPKQLFLGQLLFECACCFRSLVSTNRWYNFRFDDLVGNQCNWWTDQTVDMILSKSKKLKLFHCCSHPYFSLKMPK